MKSSSIVLFKEFLKKNNSNDQKTATSRNRIDTKDLIK